MNNLRITHELRRIARSLDEVEDPFEEWKGYYEGTYGLTPANAEVMAKMEMKFAKELKALKDRQEEILDREARKLVSKEKSMQ